MSLPILVTPAAKPLLSKPQAPATPSDKPAFSQAYGAAERRTEASRPTAAEPEAKTSTDAPETAVEETPQDAQVVSEDKGEATPAQPQAPIDLQVMVAVASQIGMPVIQAVVQPAQPVETAAVAPVVEAIAPAPVKVAIAPAVPAAEQLVAEQVKPAEVAKVADAAQPQLQVAAQPSDAPAMAAPAVQPEAGEEQETPEQNPQADKGPKPPVKPVASQQVPQSLESLRAVDKVSTLVNAAPEAPVAKSPVVDAGKPAQEMAAAALVAEATPEDEGTQPVAEAVRPWQLPHAVGAAEAQAPQAQVIEDGAPTGEAMPMREAMRMPFTQAAKEPGKASELRLQLSPEHLGRMEIRVMSHEGTLSAQIRVDHTQAREMMQTQIAELRQSLADQGIKIDRLEVSVGQDKPRGEQSFAFGGNLQQQAGQHQQQAHQPSTGRVSYYGTESFDEVSEEADALSLAGVGTTAVDYQA